MMRYDLLPCPLGTALAAMDQAGLRAVRFLGEGDGVPAAWTRDPQALCGVLAQLREYFAGGRRRFDLPLAPEGTPFQQRVWEEVCAVPWGRTVTYGELARRLGRPEAARAVGRAVGRNPLWVVIPCHRVLGASGGLTGYAGGLAAKARLLELEVVRAAPGGGPGIRPGEDLP